MMRGVRDEDPTWRDDDQAPLILIWAVATMLGVGMGLLIGYLKWGMP